MRQCLTNATMLPSDMWLCSVALASRTHESIGTQDCARIRSLVGRNCGAVHFGQSACILSDTRCVRKRSLPSAVSMSCRKARKWSGWCARAMRFATTPMMPSAVAGDTAMKIANCHIGPTLLVGADHLRAYLEPYAQCVSVLGPSRSNAFQCTCGESSCLRLHQMLATFDLRECLLK